MDYVNGSKLSTEAISLTIPVLTTAKRLNHGNQCSKDTPKESVEQTEYLKVRNRDITTYKSLVLEETSERKIRQSYSIISFTSQLYPKRKLSTLKDAHNISNGNKKPLIKVTIIANRVKTQTGNFFRRPNHKRSFDKIHSTSSNQENKRLLKNTFSSDNRNKGEIFHKTKESESAKFSTDHSKYVDSHAGALHSVADIKHVIDSLGMDKRKKKRDRSETIHDGSRSSIVNEVSNDRELRLQECTCWDYDNNYQSKREPRRRSRIRISGRLGITEDDKYILNCSAAVNNKPIATSINGVQIPSKFAPDIITQRYRPQQDFCIQVNLRDQILQGQLSQGTQANFDFNVPSNNSLDILPKDKFIQCDCGLINNKTASVTGKRRGYDMKKNSSPIFVISVYPHEKTDRNNDNNNLNAILQTNQNKYKMNVSSTNTKSKSRTTSRSPSPTKMSSRQHQKKSTKPNSIRVNSTSPKVSPDRMKNTAKTMPKEKSAQQNRKIEVSRLKTETKPQNMTKHQNNNYNKTEITPDGHITKKGIVDGYTKALNESLKKRENNFAKNTIFSKANPSKIHVNIDTDNEYYDLLYHQNKKATDFKIKKTIKTATNKPDYWNSDARGTKNNMHNLEKRLEQDLKYKNEQKLFTGEQKKSFLNIRDSLEIATRSQSRERERSGKVTQTYGSAERDRKDFIAPVKHYKGDNCCLHDPVQRDKEIRTLLGVNKNSSRITKSKFQDICKDTLSEDEIGKSSSIISFCDGVFLNNNMQFYKSKNYENQDQEIIVDKLLTRTSEDHYDNKQPIKKYSHFPNVDVRRDVQVLMHTKEFNKKKPICLSRKQYILIKKAVYRSLYYRNPMSKHKYLSMQSIKSCTVAGVVKKKMKDKVNKEVQTKIKYNMINKAVETFLNETNEVETEVVPVVIQSSSIVAHNISGSGDIVPTMNSMVCNESETNESTRQTIISALEIHYANVSYMKNMNNSSTQFDKKKFSNAPELINNLIKTNNSIHTIFKGRKRSCTPNLGTSAYSLCLEGGKNPSDKSLQNLMTQGNSKSKKPFLRRLMSCLVFRNATVSKPKVNLHPTVKSSNKNSSIDSYHISTSLGAFEMSSSLYDTSASYYSNHTIFPLNSKLKRGFFTSLRELIINRRS